MSILAPILALLFTSLIAIALWWGFRRRPASATALCFVKSSQRKLTPEEHIAVEKYLRIQPSNILPSFDFHSQAAISSLPVSPMLPPLNDDVYTLIRAITRYSFGNNDEPNKWRYYLDAIEVHLPPTWAQYITQDNYVEVIQTSTIPLIISLNGHSLKNFTPENSQQRIVPIEVQNASIRREESEHIELINIRKETPEEHTLHAPHGIKESVAICIALLLLFFSLNSPAVVLPWLILVAITIIIWACWRLFRPLSKANLQEVHCLSGTPKRWGLFGESNQNQMNNISLGIIDLIYPPHWSPYFSHDLDKKTNIDIYLNRQVVRQGRYLSLHDEANYFPLQHWGKNLTLMAGSLLILILMLFYVPLGLPLKLSIAWLQGAQTQQVTHVEALEKIPLRIGDMLKVQGTGMCYVPLDTRNPHNFVFTPFDCSGIYWNNAAPLPQPESAIIEKAAALMTAVNQQLHPQASSDVSVNPQLATAIEKSGMILLDNFSEIILKTEALCEKTSDCIRLKNALINLGNAKNWPPLIKKARSGKLNGINVLLRPVSADALENLVNTATSSFVYRETHLATEALNTPPLGGFLLTSDEGQQLVDHPEPSLPLFDYSALEQWRELQRLSRLLLNTPFKAEGVITNISVDANSVHHITLHSEPDMVTLSRYQGTSLLLLAMIICLVTNSLLSISRLHKNSNRMADIQRYYDSCFNPSFSSDDYFR